MDAHEFTAALDRLDWPDWRLAVALSVRTDTVAKWRKGKLSVPRQVGLWVSELAASWPDVERAAWAEWVAAHPVPTAPAPAE